MNRRVASFILGLALALLLGGAVWWFLAGRGGGSRAPGAGPAAVSGPTEKVVFNLYFAADGGRLRGEPRELDVTAAPKDRIRKILAALLAGPKQPGLYPLFPKEVSVGSVQLGQDGTAYVDLRWPEQPDPPASGSTEEMQRVYGIVNSIVLNVPQASQVVLLWNGFQRESFSGHLDMSQPLSPDRTLVAP
ncbi:MAG TPA: GerMN domain-containing protein [Thermoanaerobaculia bacterium]|nr:GerMN domain-containing protein [Thermoanaerobaculia bacterium]